MTGRPPTPMRERFERMFQRDLSDQCWIWQGRTHVGGYGYFAESPDKNWLAHRLSYEFYVRPLEANEHIHHVCENKLCVNPAHLLLTTVYDHHEHHLSTHCKNGHAFTSENELWDSSTGRRRCRTCRNAWDRERKRRKRDSVR